MQNKLNEGKCSVLLDFHRHSNQLQLEAHYLLVNELAKHNKKNRYECPEINLYTHRFR